MVNSSHQTDGKKRIVQSQFCAVDIDALDGTGSMQSPGRGSLQIKSRQIPSLSSAVSPLSASKPRRSYDKSPRSNSCIISGLPQDNAAPSPMTSGSSISPPMDLKMPIRKPSMDKAPRMMGLRMPIRKPSRDKLSQMMGLRMPIRKPSMDKLFQRISAVKNEQTNTVSKNKSNELFPPQSPSGSAGTTTPVLDRGHAHPNRRGEMSSESQGSSASSLHTLTSPLDGKETKAFEISSLSIRKIMLQNSTTIPFRRTLCKKNSE
eukprot:scaffold19531_cov106-Cylindrotheca_fusiformis.AAC.4